MIARASDKAPDMPTDEELDKKAEQKGIDEFKEQMLKRGYAWPLDTDEFLGTVFKIDWLAEGFLVRNQAAMVGGVYKGMKTFFSLDVGLSLASNTRILGRFNTWSEEVVLFASAESGMPTLQRNLLGLARNKEINIDLLRRDKKLHMQGWVPRIKDVELMQWFDCILEKIKPTVVILDPLYLMLDGESAHNVQINGQQIADLVSLISRHGATAIVDDHTKRTSNNTKEFQPITLEDITGAGKAEYFRQWLLLGRRSPFQETESLTKQHELWLSIGGSAGHSGCYGLDIIEVFNERYSSVEYEINIAPAGEIRQEVKKTKKTAQETKEAEKEKRHNERIERKAKELIDVVYAKDVTLALTKTDIKERLRGVSGGEVGDIVGFCLMAKTLVMKPGCVIKNKKAYDGYMLPDTIFSVPKDE